MDRSELYDIEIRLAEREAELARVQRIGLIGGLEVDLRNGGFANKRSPGYLAVHGLPPSAANETHEQWLGRIHPDDRARMQDHFLNSVRGTARDYVAEYRVVRPSDGEIRWIFAKGEIERDAQGAPIRFVGAHLDVTDRRHLEDQSELIAKELSHRIKNTLAVIQGVTRALARDRPEAKAFAQDLIDRIQALSKANDLVRPRHADRTGHAGGLVALVEAIAAPYRSAADDVVTFTGTDHTLGPTAATSLALIIHELATNAAKYGALSTGSGRIAIDIAVDGTVLTLKWTETGGPAIAAPPTRSGFGTTMSERVARGQFGATVEREWRPEGLAFSLALPISALDQ